jgi:hypothetical protein
VITVPCPRCAIPLHAPPESAGKAVRCPRCGQSVPVPAPRPLHGRVAVPRPAFAPPPGFVEELTRNRLPPAPPARRVQPPARERGGLLLWAGIFLALLGAGAALFFLLFFDTHVRLGVGEFGGLRVQDAGLAQTRTLGLIFGSALLLGGLGLAAATAAIRSAHRPE